VVIVKLLSSVQLQFMSDAGFLAPFRLALGEKAGLRRQVSRGKGVLGFQLIPTAYHTRFSRVMGAVSRRVGKFLG